MLLQYLEVCHKFWPSSKWRNHLQLVASSSFLLLLNQGGVFFVNLENMYHDFFFTVITLDYCSTVRLTFSNISRPWRWFCWLWQSLYYIFQSSNSLLDKSLDWLVLLKKEELATMFTNLRQKFGKCEGITANDSSPAILQLSIASKKYFLLPCVLLP